MPAHLLSLFFSILMLASIFCPLAATQPDEVELAVPGLTLRADRWDHVTINTPQGDTLLTLTKFQIKWHPTLVTNGGVLRIVTEEDGALSLEINYQLLAPLPSATFALPKITGRFTPRPGRVDVVFDISEMPEVIPNPGSKNPTRPIDIKGCMFGRQFKAGSRELPTAKLGLWKRHEHGGLPSEHPDGKLIRHLSGGHIVSFAFGTGSNEQWKDTGSQHIGVRKVSDGRYVATFSILISPIENEWPPELISARWHGRPAGLKISTPKTYNWWDASPPDDPPALDIALANTGREQTARPVVVKHWIRDYAGNIISQANRPIILEPGILWRDRLAFSPSPASIDPNRDLFFAEVSVMDQSSSQELAFDRTHIALLPPHSFKSTPSDSIMGLSAWWPIPNEQEVKRLMERMGIRWLRQGKTRDFQNIEAILHNNIDWKKEYTEFERDEWICREFKRCIDAGNTVWEFSNEINYASLNIGLGDTLKGEARRKIIAKYVDWLKAIRRIQQEIGPEAQQIKILSVGLAGMDVGFVEALHDAGGWELIDGIALHPGRGNFAVDYPVYDPPVKIDSWDDWKNWKLGAHGSYWNFYGSVITAKALIARYDSGKSADDPTRKTLWLTEVYSPGWPNSWWEDTPRVGGENAILTMAISHAEDVRAAFWYQLFDSVWWNRLAVNPNDREFYFGLIQRDLSFKPSLMGFCAAAEALDQAEFKGWIRFPTASNPKTRGLHFETPSGSMSILWDRSEGYILTERKSPFISPEPWIENWKTRTPASVPASGSTLTVINAIGQKQTLRVSNGTATLTLTGAPLIVYGIETSKLTLRK